MLDHLSQPTSQDGKVRNLDHLLKSRSLLYKHLGHFLIFCKVEGFSPKTTQNYTEIIRPFIKYCLNDFGIDDPSGLTAHHIRNYLLTFKDRVKPYTFYDYFRSIKRYF
ncbi:MAG: phage integrase N-terminal SAM-like domain-containing protein, partial [Dehalococcoidales bacterium]